MRVCLFQAFVLTQLVAHYAHAQLGSISKRRSFFSESLSGASMTPKSASAVGIDGGGGTNNAAPIPLSKREGKKLHNLIAKHGKNFDHTLVNWEKDFSNPEAARIHADRAVKKFDGKTIHEAATSTDRDHSHRTLAALLDKSEVLPFMKVNKQSRTRDLEEETPVSVDNLSCETAEIVQPPGPGQEIVVSGNIVEVPSDVDQLDLCSGFTESWDNVYYTFVGTGNPFYISTCTFPEDDLTTLDPVMQIAKGGTCGDSDSFTCVETSTYGSSSHCPSGKSAVSYTLATESGESVYFSLRGFLGDNGNFTLRVGEIDVAQASDSAMCSQAELLSLPGVDQSSSSVVSLDGHYSTEYNSICGEDDGFTSGAWFKIESERLSKVTLSTCSESTTVFGTTVSVIAESADGLSVSTAGCSNETLSCFKTGRFDFGCDIDSGYGSASIVTRPGDSYFVFVSNEFDIGMGDVELTVTEEEPTASEYCEETRLRAETFQPGYDCNCDYSSEKDAYILTCSDPCEYCDASGEVCYKAVDTLQFDRDLSIPEQVVDIQYLEGLSWNVIYSEKTDGTCTMSIDGTMCSSCVVEECGQPAIDCSNVVGADPDVYAAVDVCTAASFEASSPFYFLSDDFTCPRFLSERVCIQTAGAFESQLSLTCECTASSAFGRQLMNCDTQCGVFCNDEGTSCGIWELEYWFDPDGTLAFIDREFDYTTGNADNVEFQDFSPGSGSCTFELNDEDCTSCVSQECSDGSSDLLLDCTNFPEGDIYDMCDENLTVSSGPFEALTKSEFQTCTSQGSASNGGCENAIALSANSTTYVSSNQGISATASDTCRSSNQAILYFTVVGNGNTFVATTCTEETNFDTVMSISTGPCDDIDCISSNDDSSCDAASGSSSVEWSTTTGTPYNIIVGGWLGNEGTFGLRIDDLDSSVVVEDDDDAVAPVDDDNENEVDDEVTVGNDDVAGADDDTEGAQGDDEVGAGDDDDSDLLASLSASEMCAFSQDNFGSLTTFDCECNNELGGSRFNSSVLHCTDTCLICSDEEDGEEAVCGITSFHLGLSDGGEAWGSGTQFQYTNGNDDTTMVAVNSYPPFYCAAFFLDATGSMNYCQCSFEVCDDDGELAAVVNCSSIEGMEDVAFRECSDINVTEGPFQAFSAAGFSTAVCPGDDDFPASAALLNGTNDTTIATRMVDPDSFKAFSFANAPPTMDDVSSSASSNQQQQGPLGPLSAWIFLGSMLIMLS